MLSEKMFKLTARRVQSPRILASLLLLLGVSLFLYLQTDLHLSYSSSNGGCPAPNVTKPRPVVSEPQPYALHAYRPDGLVQVNPEGAHPIPELIKTAQAQWDEKLRRASRTLGEAVVEYRRRYGRAPPKGFDDWWRYAQENTVQLPDEYDSIRRDLEPFWGINPVELGQTQQQQQTKPDSFTICKNATHPPHLARTAFFEPETWRERALLRGLDEILDLLKPVNDLLPDFCAVFSPHDNPNLLSDYHVKKAALDAAAAGTYMDLSAVPSPKHLGFVSACAPGSPARPHETPINQHIRPAPRTDKTFIHSHRLAMDPCMHPHLFYHHGQYVAHDLGPAPEPALAAQFAYCVTPLYHDLQTPGFIAWDAGVSPHDIPWAQKTDERLMWRGKNTGMNLNAATRWQHAQRTHLVRWANEMNGSAAILMPQDGLVGVGTEMRKAVVNPAMMDVAFTGEPIGCDKEYCEYLETLFEWRRPQDAYGKEAGNHKYMVDVDGNGWSSRFKRLISSNSLIFKATIYPEWWLDRIQPWVHYVPVQVDYTDLYDAYVFFRGGLYGEGNHDGMAQQIATAGAEWSRAFWRREDMTAYFFRMFLEYARVMAVDRDQMSYGE